MEWNGHRQASPVAAQFGYCVAPVESAWHPRDVIPRRCFEAASARKEQYGDPGRCLNRALENGALVCSSDPHFGPFPFGVGG